MIKPLGTAKILNQQRGFSLVELMVSVAIVGILAAMGGPTYEGMVDKAKYGRAMGDMANIRAAAMSLRSAEDALLTVAMNASYTSGQWAGVAFNVTPVCATPFNANAQWNKLSMDVAPFDPWGQCYVFDENEGEGGPGDCRYDIISSAGKNQKWSGSADGDDVFDDDTILRIPYYYEHPNCHGSLTSPTGGN